MTRIHDEVEVRSNLRLCLRERGKIIAKREGHNIWLNTGREYLAQLMALQSYVPDTPMRNDRIKYMGFGIGGTRQLATALANSPPMSVAYPGTNLQVDTDPTLTRLERPVRISGSTTGPTDPYSVADVWLATIQAPPIQTTATQITFRRIFAQTEISYGTFSSVPLSEIGLFTSQAQPLGQPYNVPVAYDTFDTLSKTGAFELELDWTVRF